MKRLFLSLIACCTLVALSGCILVDHHHGHGGFYPPGQAKKHH